jgi:hypothetical protein
MLTGLYFFYIFPALVPYTSVRATHNLFGAFCLWTEAIMICFMYAYIQRLSRNMSYFGWFFAVTFESKISTGLGVTRQFLSHVHISNVPYKSETFSVRNIWLRWLFPCVCFAPCAIAVAALSAVLSIDVCHVSAF